ncbi:hypothetical protein [Blastococcus sp. TF02A-26]|uniref:hypothetical protein n=1 Tax=Blastococcus sp. TF02A-26 TaxID=2250577 RepID=UPI000DEB5727|nr:hypothetical protein [Blastococcus sp. TF02A-26]RBY88312.1 hypothetical protein DQ240_05650 [Blastococcus sp. TF02A-26]
MSAPAPASAPAVPAPRLAASAGLPEWALLPLAAVVWWVGGHLWWLLGGMDAYAGTSALPLAAGWLSWLVLGALTGGVGAGLVGRLGRRRGLSLAATGSGLALAVAVTLLQSLASVSDAPGSGFDEEPVVLAGLSAVVVTTAVGGWLLGSAALLGRPGLGVGLGVLAGLAPPWSSSVVSAVAHPSGSGSLGTVSAWFGAIVLVAALVAVGTTPPLRLLWWPLVVLLAWSTGPLMTAAAWLEPLLRPGYGLPDTLPDALSGAWQVFRLSASPDARDLTPWVVALVVAVVIALVVPLLRRGGATPSRDHGPAAGSGILSA